MVAFCLPNGVSVVHNNFAPRFAACRLRPVVIAAVEGSQLRPQQLHHSSGPEAEQHCRERPTSTEGGGLGPRAGLSGRQEGEVRKFSLHCMVQIP